MNVLKLERNKVAEPYIIACNEITLRNKLYIIQSTFDAWDK